MQRLQVLQSQLVFKNETSGLGAGTFVLKNIVPFSFEKVGNLKGKTMVVTGGSRGIGLAIAKNAAKDGANVAILAKTVTPHPKLEGTIYTAAKEIENAGGKALPIGILILNRACDIRNEESVKKAIQQVVDKFGGIDILINNASAINLVGTEEVNMKSYDLMHQINLRGTFMVSKYCIPYLKEGKNPHILNLSPPLNMEARWFQNHCAYTMAKYGMSMCVLGMSAEFKEYNVGVNALWPRTSIATAAVNNLLGGSTMMQASRTDQIMADAAYIILTSSSKTTNGNFFIDDEVLVSSGITDLDQYKVDKKIKDSQLMPDFFI